MNSHIRGLIFFDYVFLFRTFVYDVEIIECCFEWCFRLSRLLSSQSRVSAPSYLCLSLTVYHAGFYVPHCKINRTNCLECLSISRA